MLKVMSTCTRLVSETVAARTTGTTVTVEKLFEKLPVRRNEFVKYVRFRFDGHSCLDT